MASHLSFAAPTTAALLHAIGQSQRWGWGCHPAL